MNTSRIVTGLSVPAARVQTAFGRRIAGGIQRRCGGAAAFNVAKAQNGQFSAPHLNRFVNPMNRFLFGCGLCAGALLQVAFGNQQAEAYEYKFQTKANAEDMSEFYGAEDFMEVFGVFPFIAKFFLRMAQFDEAGVAHTYGLPGALDIKLTFDQDEEDTNGDGEPDTITGFNKKMEWDNFEPFSGAKLWEMEHNFGFKQLDDETYEVTHKGSDYKGPYMLVWVWRLHAWYVSKATEIYLNDSRFSEEDADEDREHLRNLLVLKVSADAIKNLPYALFNYATGVPYSSPAAHGL